MKLVVICCRITKIIQMICRGTSHSWVSCPSRGAKTTRIHASAPRFKHLFSRVIMASGKFKSYFKPVNKSSYCEDKSFSFHYRSFTFANSLDCYSKRNQYKCMTPNKLKALQASLKGFLELMYCSKLHCIFIFFLHTLILTPKFLKSHVFLRDYGEISMYSDNILNIKNIKIEL